MKVRCRAQVRAGGREASAEVDRELTIEQSARLYHKFDNA